MYRLIATFSSDQCACSYIVPYTIAKVCLKFGLASYCFISINKGLVSTSYIQKEKQWLFAILKLAVFTVLVGRAYEHFFFDIPLSSLLWDQSLMSTPVKWLTGLSWEDFSKSQLANDVVTYPRYAFSALYAVTALFLFVKENKKQTGDWLLLVSGFSLMFLAFLSYKNHFTLPGQFIEYSLQFGAPLFLFLFSRALISKARLILLMKIAVSLTFIGHGLYAFGFYPVPVKFIEMTCTILPIDEAMAKTFLRVAGALDFVVAIGIYWHKTEKPLLLYAAVWGGLTAMARIVAYFNLDFPLATFHQWWFQSFLRLPHMLIPLLLYMLARFRQQGVG